MTYVEVAIADPKYHGKYSLTYKTDLYVELGSIVKVPLKGKIINGIVTSIVKRPRFNLREVSEVLSLPSLPRESIDLLEWIRTYYSGSLGAIAHLFIPKYLNNKTYGPLEGSYPKIHKLPPLNYEQRSAIQEIDDPGSYLIHGVTGSGKTRVYIELAIREIKRGKSVIVLTPEIALTPQLELNFKEAFENIVVVHSKLMESERHKLWFQLSNTKEPIILIGPRSALFYPVHQIGLIIIDEAHETSYKQENAPYYHATMVGSKLANLYKAKIVLGSATPLITDYFFLSNKRRPILNLAHIASGTSDDFVTPNLIDLKSKEQFTKDSFISDYLIKAIASSISKKEQVILYLNRRGTARVIICDKCGWQALCPRCDLPLTYHGDIHLLICHSCGFKDETPTNCPICDNTEIIFKSVGTKAIADSVKKLFPDASVKRLDSDNKKGESLENIFEEVRSGKIDILVGTQTLAKGLDLPNLGLVGVIIADTSLYFPDFSSQERTYQLLTQVIGRINRGHLKGLSIIQTYNPENQIIKSVISKDWNGYYNYELDERKNYNFPPFCYLLKLVCKRSNKNSLVKSMNAFVDKIKGEGLKVTIEGPIPAFHEKINNKYHWQLVVKSKDRSNLLKIIDILPSGWVYDIDPMNLL